MVIWLVGLSGAGKTSLGRSLTERLRARGRPVVMMDGDEMRRVFDMNNLDEDYTVAARRRMTVRYQHLSSWLEAQGIDVVCCVIGMFPEVLEENRAVFQSYFEVFLDAPLDVLQSRDPKGIYRRALEGALSDVVGVDIPYASPAAPDLRISVDGNIEAPDRLAGTVVTELLRRGIVA